MNETEYWEQHVAWMERAVSLARTSVQEGGRQDHAPAVGAVIVKDGIEVAAAYRGMCGAGCHAEYCALAGRDASQLQGATVYTTLEPCSRRGPGKIPCAQRLIDAKVKTVFIGQFDPNPKIYREGWRMLRDAGVEIRSFRSDYRQELSVLNEPFLEQYRSNASDMGGAVFDYVLNKKFTVGTAPRAVVTDWSPAGSGSIHGYAAPGHIAHARYARALDEIDDPSALDFSRDRHSAKASNGGILVFANPDRSMYAVVQIDRVLYIERGDDRNELAISFEVRPGVPRDVWLASLHSAT